MDAPEELDRLRQWRDDASLTMSELREDVERLRAALKRSRGWLVMIAGQKDRPETSDIHAVVAEVDKALKEYGAAKTA